jgi:hypothetical protein
MKLDSSNMVSLHPYFKAKADKLEAIKALMADFVGRTATENDRLFYDFTMNGDEFFCREGYTGAAGALAHLDNVSALLGEMAKLADLERLEIHGPAAELDKMKPLLGNLNPMWFARECGL